MGKGLARDIVGHGKRPRGDIVDRPARCIERGKEIRPDRCVLPDRASAAVSTKNGTSNMPSWPMKRTALRTSARVGEFEGHRRQSPPVWSPDACHQLSLRLSDSIPSVAALRLRPTIALPPIRAGTPVNT